MPFSTSQYQYTSVQSWYQFYKVEKLPRTTQDHLELVFSGTSSSFTILELSSTGPGSSSVQKGQKTGTVLNFQTLKQSGDESLQNPLIIWWLSSKFRDFGGKEWDACTSGIV